MAKDHFSKKSQAERRAEAEKDAASYWAEQNQINENMRRLKAERLAREAEAAVALPSPEEQGAPKSRKKKIIGS